MSPKKEMFQFTLSAALYKGEEIHTYQSIFYFLKKQANKN